MSRVPELWRNQLRSGQADRKYYQPSLLAVRYREAVLSGYTIREEGSLKGHKKDWAFLIEEVLYFIALAYLNSGYSNRFVRIIVAMIFIILAVAIAAVNLVYNLLDTELKPILTEKMNLLGIGYTASPYL